MGAHNSSPNTNPNHNAKLTQILTRTVQLFYAFFEDRPLIFTLARAVNGHRDAMFTADV